MESFIQKVKTLSPKQVMLLAVEQQKKLQQAGGVAQQEPIAIIGAACRMPGGANDLASYWDMLADGREGVITTTHERWDMAQFYDADQSAPGKINTARLGLVDDVDLFDAAFFGIAPKEAARMDPQQRLLLETSWHALEHAGVMPQTLQGSRTGVFVGACNQDYTNLRMGIVNRFGHHTATPYDGTGTTLSVAAGRIAYTLGLQGPCFTLDTACSSSLVAIHLAVQSLRKGESNLAICGGVNLILDPTISIVFSKANMLSSDGRCKTFDAAADGYVRGEGCGVVILKPLSQAQKDGDRILGQIVGSALNQDGASQGLTAPNEHAQVALLKEALQSAGLSPDQIDYIEAHGTGTSLGDPIEMSALNTVFGKRSGQSLKVGSVKTNIGHTESASGMAGLLKVLLSMAHETLPAHLNLSTPSPLIPWDEMSIDVPTKATPWPRNEKTRYAGVSSFGFSGSNAHLIVAEAPVAPVTTAPGTATVSAHEAVAAMAHHVLPLSAKTPEALTTLRAQIAAQVQADPAVDLTALCAAAARGRNHFAWREGITFTDRKSLLTQFEHPSQMQEITGVSAGYSAFLFSGQGAQYWGMAKQLYQSVPLFRATLDTCEQMLGSSLDIPLTHLLWGDDQTALHNTRYTQPVLFCVQYALARLWQHWGMKPAVVMGHSVGEYVAACLAGVFDLADALKLITARGQLMVECCQPGAMVVVFQEEHTVRAHLAERELDLDIAAINGPGQTVLSGTQAAVDAMCEAYAQMDIRCVPLQVSHAFHSRMMAPMLDAFRAVVETVTFHSPMLTIISTMSGQQVGAEMCTADYWVAHVREPVRFAEGIATLFAQHVRCFVEVGPSAALLTMTESLAAHHGYEDARYFASLSAKKPDTEVMVASLAGLYELGLMVDWAQYYHGMPFPHVDLPAYPFQRTSYWLAHHQLGEHVSIPSATTMASVALGASAATGTAHALLGQQLDMALSESVYFEAALSLETPAYMDDHRLYGVPVVAGASHVSAALEAARRYFNRETQLCVQSVSFARALVLPERIDGKAPAVRVQFVLTPIAGESEVHVEMLSRQGDAPWQRHLTARIAPLTTHADCPVNLDTLRNTWAADTPADIFYDGFWDKGYTIGDTFKWLGDGYHTPNQALRELTNPERDALSEAYLLYPGLLDSCFQTVDRADPELSVSADADSLFIPLQIESVAFYRAIAPEERVFCYVNQQVDSQASGGKRLVSDLWLITEDHQVIAAIQGFEAGRVSRKLLESNLGAAAAQTPPSHSDALDIVYTEQWQALGLTMQGLRDQVSTAGNAAQPLLVLLDTADSLAMQTYAQSSTAPVWWVTCGDHLIQEGQHWTIAPDNPEHWQALWEMMATQEATSWDVLYLWGLDVAPVTQDASIDALTLWSPWRHWMQQVSQAIPTLNRLSFVTRGGCAVMEEASPDPLQHMLWGMVRSAALEKPELPMRLIDLSATAQAEAGQYVWALCTQRADETSETQLAIRADALYRCSLTRAPATVPPRSDVSVAQFSCSPDKWYVISGGLGDLGLMFADHLINRGARHIALLSRRAPSDAVNDTLDALNQRARVVCLPVDVADMSALETALHDLTTERALGGILHAAGTLEDGLIEQLTDDAFFNVAQAKVTGAWHLYQCAQTMQPDFLVLFSSIAAALGSAGQTNYAAANAFMDGLAGYSQAVGIPAISLQWGPWADGGMAARLDARHRELMAARGLSGLLTTHALAAFDRLVGTSSAAVALIATLDWARYLEHTYTTIPACFETLAQTETASASTSANTRHSGAKVSVSARADKSAPTQLGETLHELTEEARLNRVRTFVREHLASALGFQNAQQIRNRDKLFELGLDSLLAVEVKNTLQKELGFTLSATLLFDYPTLEKLAAFLCEQWAAKAGAAPSASVSASTAAVLAADGTEAEKHHAGTDDMDDDAIAALLADDSYFARSESLMEDLE